MNVMTRLFVMALAAVACGPSVTLTTDRTAYQPGAAVSLTLQNSSLSDIGYNLCLSQLIGADGVTIADTDGGVFCLLRQDQLRSGERVTGLRHLPVSLDSGSYSYSTSLEFGGSRVTALSNSFEVGP